MSRASSQGAAPAIELDRVTKRYGVTLALSDVSLTVGRGEVLGLLGPNGAGKTTTLRLLVGSLSPTSGRVRVGGVDVSERPLAVRSMVGYLPENFAPYPELRARQYLTFIAGLRRIPRKQARGRVDEVIGAAGLGPVANRLCGSLSKGYRQRLGLAQAILGRPGIVVLDEPTSGLDPVQVVEARALIAGQRTRATVIVSTHILSEAATMCTRIAVINQGRLVAEGTPDTLSQALGSAASVVIEVRGDPERVRAVIRDVPGVATVTVSVTAGVCRAEVGTIPDEDAREEIVRRLAAAGLVPTSVSRSAATLEEAFLRAVEDSR